MTTAEPTPHSDADKVDADSNVGADSNVDTDSNVDADNAFALETLVRTIALAPDEFALVLVRCNYTELRDRLLKQVRSRVTVPLVNLTIPENAKTLLTAIQCGLGEAYHSKKPMKATTAPHALMVLGLESVGDLDAFLAASNLARDELRARFPFPLVLWVNDRVLYQLSRLAPDLYNWTGNAVIEFRMATSELITALRAHAERLFTTMLDDGDERFVPNWAIVPRLNSLRQGEIDLALTDLANSGYMIEPELQASLAFLQAQDAHSRGEMETARLLYERSLRFWLCQVRDNEAAGLGDISKLPSPLSPCPAWYSERAACVLVYLGLWWRSYALLQRILYKSACRQARTCFERSLELFEQVNRQDLVANFIIPLAEVLQKLGQWQDLESLAKQALVLHKLYVDPMRQARDHGFLAEVALVNRNWAGAYHHAETALQLVEDTEAAIDPDCPQDHLETSLDVAHRFHVAWYLLLLARADVELGNQEAAIDRLEDARNRHYPPNDPQLHIQILQRLRTLYFQEGHYLEAFRTKQTQRSLEQQYGFRAFVGALRIQAPRYLLNPLLEPSDARTLLAQEIAASGRQHDVERLIARLGRNDYKLTVIHGPSGVGKSSIVHAGLLPALTERVIGDRIALPVLFDTYREWNTPLERSLETVLSDDELSDDELSDDELSGDEAPAQPTPNLIEQLQRATDRNRLPVLMFDQFEEFFFVYPRLQDRAPFYQFLSGCLNLPYVKIILTLREDYLHHLLEFQRFMKLDILNNDILSKDIRYPLSDLSPEDAKSVIKSLTNQAQFYLADDLVDELVRDLAGELGEIRPIELQVVGAQLQAEDITTLEQYHRKGPKEKLVERSLDYVVKDCGPENEEAAWSVLLLLTDMHGTRPLKTRSELEAELVAWGRMKAIDKLDLVLEVLVDSGLVFLVPELPFSRYQLVHDYLVSYIRQQDQFGFMEQLERERKQREIAEERQRQSEEGLNIVLQQLILLQQQKLNDEEKQKRAAEKQLEEARLTQAFLGIAFSGVLVLLIAVILAFQSRM